MVKLDQALLVQARRLTNGANVHRVNNLVFCYQEAVRARQEGRPYRPQFETNLREFIAEASMIERTHASVQHIR